MKKLIISTYTCLSVGLLMSCENLISPELEKAEPVLVVDAWITNKPEEQIIQLTQTQPYFENSLPTGVSGAQVEIVDDQGKIYPFAEKEGVPGAYALVSFGSEVFGEVGRSFELTIQLDGDVFKSVSTMKRVPAIDSVTFTFEEKKCVPGGSLHS